MIVLITFKTADLLSCAVVAQTLTKLGTQLKQYLFTDVKATD